MGGSTLQLLDLGGESRAGREYRGVVESCRVTRVVESPRSLIASRLPRVVEPRRVVKSR